MLEMSSNPKLLIRNSIYLYIRMILVLAINLYATRLLLKYIGVEDFGLYNVIGSVVIFFSFLRTALTNATSRYLTFEMGKGDSKRLNEIYAMAINSHCILSFSLVLLIEAVGVYFLNNHLDIPSDRVVAANWVLQFSIVTFAISVIQTPFHSNIIAHERMDAYAFISIAEIVFKLLIVISLAYCLYDRLIYYGGLMMLSSILVFVLYFLYCVIKIKDTKYLWFWDKSLVKEFASYSGLSMLVNGAEIGAQQCFSIFFNRILGLTANAALGIANQVNSGILIFTTNMAQAYNPQIVKSYAAGNYSYFFKLIFASTKISFIFQLLISIPVILNIEYILDIWLGEYPAMTPNLIRVIFLFYLFYAFQYPLIYAVYANGNIKTHQIIISSIKILTIPLFYIVLRYTQSGTLAYFVWVIGGVACVIARTIYMRRLINLDIKRYCKEVVFRIFTLAIIDYVLTYFVGTLFSSDLYTLILTTISSTLIISLISITWVFDKEEKSFLVAIPVVGEILKKVIK